MEPTLLPNIGEWVNFVLLGGPCEGEVRPALVTGRFVDDLSGLSKLAKRYGRNEDECLKEFGMHVNLSVRLDDGDLPGIANGVFEIRSVRFDENKSKSTWHWPDESLTKATEA